MPQLQVKTVSSEKVWEKGDMKIFKINLEYNGEKFEAKTYSDKISQVGWSGTVETYEKAGNNGSSDTFVRQPKQEGGYQGRPAGGGGARPPQSDYTMYLSYAKDLVVAHLMAQTKDGSTMTLDDSIAATIQYGQQLYDHRPNAEADKVAGVTGKETDADLRENVDKIFIDDIDQTVGEKAWKPETTTPQLPV